MVHTHIIWDCVPLEQAGCVYSTQLRAMGFLTAPAGAPVWGITTSSEHLELMWRLYCKPSKQSVKERMHAVCQVGVYKVLKNTKAFFRLPALACWDSSDREQHRAKGSKSAVFMSVLNFRVSDMNLPVSCAGVVSWQELLRMLQTLLQLWWLVLQLAP